MKIDEYLAKDVISYRRNNCTYFPKMVQIEITKKCPFNCPQCYKESIVEEHMDYKTLKHFLNDIYIRGSRFITLNGGEPLLYPHIHELLKSLSFLEIYVNVFSSGYGIDKKLIGILKSNKRIAFYVSLNGSTEKINSTSRQGYKTSLDAIDMLCKSKVSYGINWVARKDNIDDFPNLYSLALQKGVSYISITSSKISGTFHETSSYNYNDLAKLASYINNRENKSIHIQIEACFSTLSLLVTGTKTSFIFGCYAGISSCCVNTDFSFQPCTHLSYVESFPSIEEYWNKSKNLERLRNNKLNKIGICEYCFNSDSCYFCRATNIETLQNIEKGIGFCPMYKNNG